MESELVWLEWNYSMLKTLINDIADVNSAYTQINSVVKVDPSYRDVGQ